MYAALERNAVSPAPRNKREKRGKGQAYMYLSTSSTLVCWVNLLVRTARQALATAPDCSLVQSSVVGGRKSKKNTTVLTRPQYWHPHPHPWRTLYQNPHQNPHQRATHPCSSGGFSTFLRRFFLASPLDNLTMSISRLALRNRLNSSNSESLSNVTRT